MTYLPEEGEDGLRTACLGGGGDGDVFVSNGVRRWICEGRLVCRGGRQRVTREGTRMADGGHVAMKEAVGDVRFSLAELMCVLVANWQETKCTGDGHARGLVTKGRARRHARENPDGLERETRRQPRSPLRHRSRYTTTTPPPLLPPPPHAAQVEGAVAGRSCRLPNGAGVARTPSGRALSQRGASPTSPNRGCAGQEGAAWRGEDWWR